MVVRQFVIAFVGGILGYLFASAAMWLLQRVRGARTGTNTANRESQPPVAQTPDTEAAQVIKIFGLEEALQQVPVEHREGLRDEIRRTFENFDPMHPPGEKLRVLPPGTIRCPACYEPLRVSVVLEEGSPSTRILTCEACETSYVAESAVEEAPEA